MRKLLGGLGLCLALSVGQQASAQDPFGGPNFQPAPVPTGPAFSEFPAGQSEPETPIIQTAPMARTDRPYQGPALKSRTQNAHVRSHKTQAQEYIYKRAVFEAQQRTARMEYRKWRGESLLRPNTPEHSWWYDYQYSVPVWLSSHH
jgi:hypothetical protein